MSVTEAGRAAAARLPFEHAHGSAGDTVRARWPEVDAFVLFLATGAAVRIIAPLLRDKRTDPAVVCVDEGCRYAIALTGGHEGGGNELAARVAELLGAEPVITTASESGVVVTAPHYAPAPGAPSAPRPARVVVGVGTSSDADPAAVQALVRAALGGRTADAVATIDRRADHPAIRALGLPIVAFTADELRAVDVPSPSDAVAAAVGTPSVAEAAALLAAGPGAALAVSKVKNAVATAAVAVAAADSDPAPAQPRPRGRLSLVGLGPGSPDHRTPAAAAAVAEADVVIGYGPYVDQCADLLRPHHRVVRSPIGAEVDRARLAIEEAADHRRVALVCSGDSGVYAMASIALELAGEGEPPGGESDLDIDIEVVPGVTAALAAAAAVGAPLGHDHCAISLSDLLTPWPAIERRLQAAAEADFVVSLYNPRSQGRHWQLPKALAVLGAHRPPTTPVALVTDAGRPTQRAQVTTLADLDPDAVGMTTCVIVGSTATRLADGRMVTPRGYQP